MVDNESETSEVLLPRFLDLLWISNDLPSLSSGPLLLLGSCFPLPGCLALLSFSPASGMWLRSLLTYPHVYP